MRFMPCLDLVSIPPPSTSNLLARYVLDVPRHHDRDDNGDGRAHGYDNDSTAA